MYFLKTLGFAASCLVAVSCGSKGSDDAAASDTPLEEQVPSDSTGATGQVSVNLASENVTGLTLADAAVIKINDSISLSYAKFSIAKIKIKALKAVSEKESELQTTENSTEKTICSALDSSLEDSANAEAAGKANKSDAPDHRKAAKQDRQEKISSKMDDLKAKDDEQLEKEVKKDKATKFTGPYVYDAILGKLEGDAPAVVLKDGSYRRVEFQLKRNFSVASTEPLLGNVFVIKGTVMKDAKAVPFEIDWHSALNFRLAGDTAFVVKAGEDNALLINLDMSKWFEKIDLTKATIDSDGSIYIDKSSNRDILRQLHSNIKMGAGFGKDDNGDKKLEAKEKVGEGQDTTDADVE